MTTQPLPAGALLAELDGLRRQARADRYAYWLPLLTFALLTLGSAPLYLLSPGTAPRQDTPRLLPLLSYLGEGAPRPLATELYWLGALAAGTLASLLWFRRRAVRVGVAARVGGSTRALLGVTAALVAGWVLVAWLAERLVWSALALQSRGTNAPLVVAAALLVLMTWLERGRVLAGLAVLCALAAATGALYTPANVPHALGWDIPATWTLAVNVIVPGAVLLAGGLVALALDLRRPRS